MRPPVPEPMLYHLAIRKSGNSIKIQKIGTVKTNCCNYPKIRVKQLDFCHRILYSKDAKGVTSSVDPGEKAPIWVFTVEQSDLGLHYLPRFVSH